MKAAKLIAQKQHKIIDAPIPKICMDEVLVKVKICGICASELDAWKSGIYTSNPFMGHEVVGEVEQVGENVKRFKPGDRVTGLILSGFAEYAKVHESLVVKVPHNITDEEAIGEPLGCLVSGAKRTQLEYGDSAAIVGSGYMGLGFMQLLKLKGAGSITAIDVRADALHMSKHFGADQTILAGSVPDDHRVTNYGVNMDGGYDVVAEVSGTQAGINLAGDITGVHGILSIVGFHQNGPREINMELWNWKALTVINAHERREQEMIRCIEQGLNLVSCQRLNTRDLISHRFDLAEIDKAFDSLVSKPEGYTKAIIVI